MMADDEATERIFLFLADAEGAALAGGLTPADLAGAPLARREVVEADDLLDERKDPDDLKIQGWGVVVPANGGDALHAQIAPLIAARAQQQGIAPHEVRIYEIGRDEDPTAWIHARLPATDKRRPRYLLLLGDLDDIAIELQHRLSGGSFGPAGCLVRALPTR